jgi:cyanophycin synthetase
VRQDGYAILNAEDEMTPVLREHADSRLAFFSLDPENATFREHVGEGGLGATIENGWLLLYERGMRVPLCEAMHVPISFGGKARFQLANALAAVLATYATQISVTDIVSGLLSFFQSAHTTPGRLNIVELNGFRIMIDYAHNPHGLGALCDFVRELRDNRLTAIIGLPGDRRDEDIIEAARIVGRTFDQVIIREDFNLRGRKRGEVAALIRQGLLAGGLPEQQIVSKPDEADALAYAASEAEAGDLIVFIADKPEIATALVENLRKSGPSRREAAEQRLAVS